MCETLAGLKQAVSAFAARFDAALVVPSQLPQVMSDAGTIEKTFAAVAAACAAVKDKSASNSVSIEFAIGGCG